VNGQTREIVRANHAFRLVAVPGGESEVVFTYRPLSVRAGAITSLAALVVLALLWHRGRAQHAPTASPAVPPPHQ
jgi:uncharacterized membrane protein YfhO